MKKGLERYSEAFLRQLARDLEEVTSRCGYKPGTKLNTILCDLEETAAERRQEKLRPIKAELERRFLTKKEASRGDETLSY